MYIYIQYIMGLQLFRITMVYVGVIMANHDGNYGNLLGTIPRQVTIDMMFGIRGTIPQ
jgi:hypothetical protein